MRRLRLSRGVLFGAVGSLSFFFVEIIQDGRQLVKHGAGGGGEVTGQKGWQWQNGSGGFVVQRYFGKASGDFDVRSLFLCFVVLAVLFLFSLLLLLLSFFVGQFTDAMDGLSAGHELAIDVDQHCHWRKKKKQKEEGEKHESTTMATKQQITSAHTRRRLRQTKIKHHHHHHTAHLLGSTKAVPLL